MMCSFVTAFVKLNVEAMVPKVYMLYSSDNDLNQRFALLEPDDTNVVGYRVNS